MAQAPPGSDANRLKKASSPTRALKLSRTPIQLSAEIPSERPFRAPLRIGYTQAAGDLPTPTKDSNGIPPSLLSHVTPQPYKYNDTSPAFASVKAPGSSAVQHKETAAPVSNAPPLPVAPNATNKGIPPTPLHDVTPHQPINSVTNQKGAVDKVPGSATKPHETAVSTRNAHSETVPAGSNKTPVTKRDSNDVLKSLLSRETPQPNKQNEKTSPTASQAKDTAASIISTVPKTNNNNAIPPSLLRNVTPQPYKYNDTSPTFASVKPPGSAVESADVQRSTLASKPGNSNDNRTVVTDIHPALPKSADQVNPVPNQRQSDVRPSTSASDARNRLILAQNKQSSVSTGSQASSLANSSISSVPTPVTDAQLRKGLASLAADQRKSELQHSELTSTKLTQLKSGQGLPEPGRKSEQRTSVGPTAASGPLDRGLHSASAPSTRHTVGFSQPPVTKVLELQAHLTSSTAEPNHPQETAGFSARRETESSKPVTNSLAAKTETEPKRSGTGSISAKTDTDPKKSRTSSFAIKTDTESKKSGTNPVPAKSEAEPRKSGPTPIPAKSDTEPRKSGTVKGGPGPTRRSRSGTDSRIADDKPDKPSPVQSNIDLFEGKSGVEAGSTKRKARPSSGVSDLSSNASSRRIESQTNIVSSSSRPRLAEPGYPRAIPQQVRGKGELKENQPTRKSSVTTGDKDRRRGTESSQGRVSSVAARKGSVQQTARGQQSSFSNKARPSEGRLDNSDKRSSGGDNCRLQDRSSCRFEKCPTRTSELGKCLASCDGQARKLELEKCEQARKLALEKFEQARKLELEKCEQARKLELEKCEQVRKLALEKCEQARKLKLEKSEQARKSGPDNFLPDCNYTTGNSDCKNRNAACDAVMPNVYPITAGSPDACLSAYQWQPYGRSSSNCCPQQLPYSSVNPYRSRQMYEPYYTNPCDPRPCQRPSCPMPCSPGPRPRCPRPCSPCRPICPSSPRPRCPKPCSPCRPICNTQYTPCQRPICPRPCSPPACRPCDPPPCPQSCPPRQCAPCDRPACPPPRPCSPCLPPVISIGHCPPPPCAGSNSCYPSPVCPPPACPSPVSYPRPLPPSQDCREAPNCYPGCPQPAMYRLREDCDPECDPNRCKPLVKPASREIPDNFKCIPNLQQQFLIDACVRNASAATATATHIYGESGCTPEPLRETGGSQGSGVLRHVESCDIGRNRCSTLRPTPELQRILDYRRQIEDEWEAMDAYCCENGDYAIGCECRQ